MKLDRNRSDERLQKLQKDREAMTVKAPMAGVVYHGKFTDGRFSGAGGGPGAGALREKTMLMPNQVFMTVVKARPVVIRASVAEAMLDKVRPGVKGTATPTGYSDLRLTAIVERVAEIPTASGSFDSRLTVAIDEQAEALMPGMGCKVKLVTYLKKNALTVPPKAIETDPLDDQQRSVYVVDKDGKAQKRTIEVGKRTDEKVEVLKGLSEGDQILAEPPKETK